MTLAGALAEVKAALEAGDALRAAEAMQPALAALEAARNARQPPNEEVARLVAECQPLVERLRAGLERQLGELGASARAHRAYGAR
ncbi:MAG: hypothetical protein AB1938_04380 [Myxococcota bacterium]